MNQLRESQTLETVSADPVGAGESSHNNALQMKAREQ